MSGRSPVLRPVHETLAKEVEAARIRMLDISGSCSVLCKWPHMLPTPSGDVLSGFEPVFSFAQASAGHVAPESAGRKNLR